MLQISLICYINVAILAASISASEFFILREWKYLNFTWPEGVEIKDYEPANNTLSGINYYGGYYYLSLPRMRSGVPATLVRIPEDSNNTSPLLEPYPSWEMNRMMDCDALQTVQNLEIDARGRLWIIDGGKTLTMSKTPVVKCGPKILIHDIKTNTTELVYEFPDSVINPEFTFLYDLVVDDSDGGYAYISDNSRIDPGLVVFSLAKRDSWKIRHIPTMTAQPDALKLNLNGILIDTPINIAGISLGPTKSGNREVYYCPMSSYHLYSITTSNLKNKTNSFGKYKGDVKDYGVRSSQTDSMIVDNSDNLYYGLLASNSIARWNVYEPFNRSQEVIAKSVEFFQWPKAFTFDDQGDLVVLTNKLHKFLMRTLDLDEINFRLMASNVGTDSYIFKNSSSTSEKTMDNDVYFRKVAIEHSALNVTSGNGRVRLLFSLSVICLAFVCL